MSNLRIGFANKFFTLWSVEKEKQYSTNSYGTHYCTGVITRYSYLGKLAIDESKAIEKAKAKGCINLIPDEGLKGQKKSFWEYRDIKVEDGCFKHGWRKGQLISDCTDIKDLVNYGWHNALEVIDQLNELAPNTYMVHENHIRKIEEVKAEEIRNQIWEDINAGKLEMVATSNFTLDGNWGLKAFLVEETDEHFDFNQNHPYGIRLDFSNDHLPFQLQHKFYNGYSYYTPDGKRSFKNTKFRIIDNKLVLS